mgnify:FL=1
MSYKITKKEKNNYEVEITISAEEWENAVEATYQADKNRFSVQGFRKGKAPRKVIEKNYGEMVFFDGAFERAFSEEYGKFLDENKDFEPIVQPDVKIDKFGKEGLVVTASVAGVPEVKLGAYTGLTVKKECKKATKKEVEDELKMVAERSARFVDASDDEAKMGDFATIDFVGMVDGEIFEGGSATNYRLELGSKSFIDTFEDQIVGMKVGDNKDVNVTFPANYGAENLQNKPAVFKVTLEKIERKQLPEINDAFASNVSEFETLEDYKKDIEKRMNIKKEQEAERKLENDLIEKIVDASEVEVPEILIERQLDMFIKDLEARLSYQGLKLDEYLGYLGTDVQKLREERKEQAKQSCKTRLVLEELIKKENLYVTDEELNAKLQEMADLYKKDLEEYKKTLDNNTIAYFENDILMKKLLDFLKANNTIA